MEAAVVIRRRLAGAVNNRKNFFCEMWRPDGGCRL
jgi:hypothetical protein